MPPRVLLVYANPAITASPVPPYGMERVAQSFRLAGCELSYLAPFIEEDPLAALQAALEPAPDLVGFSVRNVDDALVVRSELGPGEIDTAFYLDAVRPLVAAALARVGPDRVLLGGAALSSGPVPVLRYLGASLGISGPAEDLCYWIGRALVRGEGVVIPEDPRVIRASEPADPPHRTPPRPRGFAGAWRAPPGPTPRMGGYLRLTTTRGGRVPVQIASGCDRRCSFCVEARFTGYQVRPRPADEVVAEIQALQRAGVSRFWLATSELNVPTAAHGIEVLRRLAGMDLDLQVFLQVAPVDDALLDALEGAGVDPAGISYEFGHFDPDVLRAGGGPANRAAIDRLVELYLRRGYTQLGGSVLLGAHWLETERTLQGALDYAREVDRAFHQGLGLSYATGGRVYPETALADWIAANREEARPHLYGEDDPSFVRPVIFSRPMAPRRLMAWVKARLEGARGNMGPMNAEAPADPSQIEAERLVNRGIWREAEGRYPEARAAFEAALRLAPRHLEALAQLSLLLANQLDDPLAARRALGRLLSALGPDDLRRPEVEAALRQLA